MLPTWRAGCASAFLVAAAVAALTMLLTGCATTAAPPPAPTTTVAQAHEYAAWAVVAAALRDACTRKALDATLCAKLRVLGPTLDARILLHQAPAPTTQLLELLGAGLAAYTGGGALPLAAPAPSP